MASRSSFRFARSKNTTEHIADTHARTRRQEEERERRDNYVPLVSVIDVDSIQIDNETKDLLRAMDMSNLKGVNVVPVLSNSNQRTDQGRDGGDRERGDRPPRRDGPRRDRKPKEGAAAAAGAPAAAAAPVVAAST